MKLTFNIEYRTQFGEELVVNILNAASPARYRMMTADGVRWTCTVDLPATAPKAIAYLYEVEREGRTHRCEWPTLAHRLETDAAGCESLTAYDTWHAMPEDSYLYSSAFTDCLCRHQTQPPQRPVATPAVRLVVRAPQLREGQRLAIVGEGMELGGWHADKALPMQEHSYNEWTIALDANMFPYGDMEFKFVALGSGDADAVWETGFNRTLRLPGLRSGQMVAYDLDQAFFPIADMRVAGTLVPLFSLRSQRSFGVGDFGDLRRFVDYVAQTGQHVLQLLPVNDTTATHTWTDSYPYSCISIFALHPQYADLDALPRLKDKAEAKRFDGLREELNALAEIDYERVNDAKIRYLRLLYAQEGEAAMATHAFRRFFGDNERWLVPYAQFCTLRDRYATADFAQWPDHNTWREDDREALSDSSTEAYRDVAFWYYVQYVLDAQLAEAHDYARSHRVILKGDIPIGVSRHGCDVWTEPRYFNLNGQAGAPPDAFAVDGQNWGFPTYNWDAMLEDGCLWWVRRFKNMAKYFDAYRIDHVLGFFRIWEIPTQFTSGLAGQFSPALAMTADEIRSYGLNFQEERFTEPFITDWVLDRVFGDRAAEVRSTYLDAIDGERYRLKPAYGTQRKIMAAVDDKALADGLASLARGVLFVRDRKDPHRFHPRITAQMDFTYESLYDVDKQAFNRLYDDYFYRRNNQFWYGEAMKKLPTLVQATRMLVCAEDLGMVPACVPWVMSRLRILSLEIQTMPKDPSVNFGHLSRNPYRSVCTFSTHDMPTLRQWWDEDYARAQEYYNTRLYRQGAAPHPLPADLARDIVYRQLASPSMLCVLSIQDWLAIDGRLRRANADDERVNIPANPRHYWRYRMHLTIEDLMRDEAFTQSVSSLVSQSGR